MKLSVYIFNCFFCISNLISGQTDSVSMGNIKIQTDAGFNELLEKYKKLNYSESTIDGYRVQIFTDAGNNAKDRANKVLQEFKSTFSDIPVYISYQQPYFKVRCGNFRNKPEARKLQKRIAYLYYDSFIIKDEIQ